MKSTLSNLLQIETDFGTLSVSFPHGEVERAGKVLGVLAAVVAQLAAEQSADGFGSKVYISYDIIGPSQKPATAAVSSQQQTSQVQPTSQPSAEENPVSELVEKESEALKELEKDVEPEYSPVEILRELGYPDDLIPVIIAQACEVLRIPLRAEFSPEEARRLVRHLLHPVVRDATDLIAEWYANAVGRTDWLEHTSEFYHLMSYIRACARHYARERGLDKLYSRIARGRYMEDCWVMADYYWMRWLISTDEIIRLTEKVKAEKGEKWEIKRNGVVKSQPSEIAIEALQV